MKLPTVPLSLDEAQKSGRCRYCHEVVAKIEPDNHLILSYGQEYAHERCIRQRLLDVNVLLDKTRERVETSQRRIELLKAQRDAIELEIKQAQQRQLEILMEATGVTYDAGRHQS